MEELEHARDFRDENAPRLKRSGTNVTNPKREAPNIGRLASRHAAARAAGDESDPAKSNTERLKMREWPNGADARPRQTKLCTGNKLAT